MTPAEIGELLLYNQETGHLTWKISRKGRGCVAGWPAGTLNHRRDTSYLAVTLHGKKHYAHRLAWILSHGEIPAGMHIDHIDGDGTNNRLSNLRLASRSVNQRNKKLGRNSRTGVAGVHSGGKGGYVAHVANQYIRYTKDFFEACCLRKSAELKEGFHENHGRKL